MGNRFVLPEELKPVPNIFRCANNCLICWYRFFLVIFIGLAFYYAGFLTHKYIDSGLKISEIIKNEFNIVYKALK